MSIKIQHIKSIFYLWMIICTSLTVACLTVACAVAGEKSEIFTGILQGVAVAGYDTVAYFKVSKPVKGISKYQTVWKGAIWRFSSEENLKEFIKSPERYAPQYGGYCAYGVARGYTAKGEPEQWTIFKDKLYLNYSPKIQKTWKKDILMMITKANQAWPKVLQ